MRRLGARRGGRAGGLLLLLGLACGQRAVPLTDTEWLGRYTAVPTYDQPTWSRTNDYSSPSSGHLALQRAAVLHQQGQLDATVQLLKSVLQKADASHHHGEAYAALAKVRVKHFTFFFLFVAPACVVADACSVRVFRRCSTTRGSTISPIGRWPKLLVSTMMDSQSSHSSDHGAHVFVVRSFA